MVGSSSTGVRRVAFLAGIDIPQDSIERRCLFLRVLRKDTQSEVKIECIHTGVYKQVPFFLTRNVFDGLQ